MKRLCECDQNDGEEEEDIQIVDECDYDDTLAYYDSKRNDDDYLHNSPPCFIPQDLVIFFREKLTDIQKQQELKLAQKLRSIREDVIKVKVPKVIDDIVIDDRLVNPGTQLLIEQSFYVKDEKIPLLSKVIEFRIERDYEIAYKWNKQHPVFSVNELFLMIVQWQNYRSVRGRLKCSCKAFYDHPYLQEKPIY